jgi:hypothetical protein
MDSRIKQETETKYSKVQHQTFIVCTVVMVVYVVFVCIVTHGSFCDFAAVHTALAAVALIFIWIGEAPKVMTYVGLFLSIIGAGSAVAIILWYLIILGNLATR